MLLVFHATGVALWPAISRGSPGQDGASYSWMSELQATIGIGSSVEEGFRRREKAEIGVGAYRAGVQRVRESHQRSSYDE